MSEQQRVEVGQIWVQTAGDRTRWRVEQRVNEGQVVGIRAVDGALKEHLGFCTEEALRQTCVLEEAPPAEEAPAALPEVKVGQVWFVESGRGVVYGEARVVERGARDTSWVLEGLHEADRKRWSGTCVVFDKTREPSNWRLKRLVTDVPPPVKVGQRWLVEDNDGNRYGEAVVVARREGGWPGWEIEAVGEPRWSRTACVLDTPDNEGSWRFKKLVWPVPPPTVVQAAADIAVKLNRGELVWGAKVAAPTPVPGFWDADVKLVKAAPEAFERVKAALEKACAPKKCAPGCTPAKPCWGETCPGGRESEIHLKQFRDHEGRQAHAHARARMLEFTLDKAPASYWQARAERSAKELAQNARRRSRGVW